MNRLGTLKLLVLSIASSGTSLAFGQTTKDDRQVTPIRQAPVTSGRSRRWAVVIGVNGFVDRKIPPLRYCVADARLVVKTLIERCGFEEEHILLIADDQPLDLRPMKLSLQNQVPTWLKQAQPGDMFIIYFSGHGFLDARGVGYLAAQDCELANLGLTALRIDELREGLRQCKATQKLLVLDSCHAGGEKGGGPVSASSQVLAEVFNHAQGLVTLASCSKDQTSREWEAKGHGLFTYFLAEGLTVKGDADGNGVVDSDELYNYVCEKVILTGQRELNHEQTPVRIIGEDTVGRFPLALLMGQRKSGVQVIPASPEPGPSPAKYEGVLPPLVVITSPDHSGVRLDKPELTVSARAIAHPGHPVTALRLLLDDRPYTGDQELKGVRSDPADGRQKTAGWQGSRSPV